MPNKFKINKTGTEQNSYFDGDWAITPLDKNEQPSSVNGFLKGIEVPTGSYVVYGPGPNVYFAKDETDLVSIVNRLGASVTTGFDALVWSHGQANVHITSSRYEDIVTNGLVLNLDASKKASLSSNTEWRDISGNNNHAAIVGNPTAVIDTENEYLSFDGENDYGTVNHSTSLNLGGGSITVAAYMKSNTATWVPSWNVVSRYNQFILGVNSSNDIAFLVHTDQWRPLNYNSAIWGQNSVDPEEYHYYVGVFDSAAQKVRLYIDGILEVELDAAGSMANDTGPINIARRENDGVAYLPSNIKNVQIYNRALSVSEIQQNYNAISENSIPLPIDTGLYGKRYSGYFADNVNWWDTATEFGQIDQTTQISSFTNTADNYSWTWLGYFKPSSSGTWTFYTASDDASYLWIGETALNGYTTTNAIVKNGGLHGVQERSGTVTLEANKLYPIRIMFGELGGGDVITVQFEGPGRTKTTDGKGYYYGGKFAWSNYSGFNNHRNGSIVNGLVANYDAFNPISFQNKYNLSTTTENPAVNYYTGSALWGPLPSSAVVTRTSNAITGPDGISLAPSYNKTSGTGIRNYNFNNIVDGFTKGHPVTFSIWAKADSNTTITLDINDQISNLSKNIALTTAWQKFTISGNLNNEYYPKLEWADIILPVGINVYLWGAHFHPYGYGLPYISGADLTYSLKNLINPANSATLTNGVKYKPFGGGSFVFDGVNDYIQIPRPVSDDFTISCWFKTTQNTGNPTAWYQSNGLMDCEMPGATNDFGLSIGLGRVVFGVGNPDVTIRTDFNSKYNDGVWHMATATRNRTTGEIKLYVDGELKSSAIAGNTNSLTSASNMRIGSLQTNIGFFSGEITANSAYNRVLSAGEIYKLYESHSQRFGRELKTNPIIPDVTDGLTIKYDFGNPACYSGTGTLVNDLVGSNTATLVNGPIYSANHGGYFYLDGGNDRITFNNPISGMPFSISMWYFPNRINTSFDMLYSGSDNADVQIFFNATTKRLVTSIENGEIEVPQLTLNSSSINKWYNIVLTHDGLTRKTYINGELVQSVANSVSLVMNDATVAIGSLRLGNYNISGHVGPFHVYNRVINDGEVLQNYYTYKDRFGL